MKRLIIGCAIALSAFSLCGCMMKVASNPAKPPTYQNVSVKEAQSLMEKEKGFLIVDVRTPAEFEEMHIKDAINVPLESIEETKSPDSLPKKDQLLFVYCRTGRRSKLAAEKLLKLGYTNIVEFGGIVDWLGPVEISEEKMGEGVPVKASVVAPEKQ